MALLADLSESLASNSHANWHFFYQKKINLSTYYGANLLTFQDVWHQILMSIDICFYQKKI